MTIVATRSRWTGSAQHRETRGCLIARLWERLARLYSGRNWNPALLKKSDIDPQIYRDAMARFAGAVHVLTTDGPAGRRGTTVIAACSVSDKPPTILVCINRENVSNALFTENGAFALNTLGAAHRDLANAFSGLTGLTQDERFAHGTWTRLASGTPILADSMMSLDGELTDTADIATHRVLFGKVTGVRIGDSVEPLMYFNRAYHVL
jgi:cob(II)yrinic acid a,c-diamide reductase